MGTESTEHWERIRRQWHLHLQWRVQRQRSKGRSYDWRSEPRFPDGHSGRLEPVPAEQGTTECFAGRHSEPLYPGHLPCQSAVNGGRRASVGTYHYAAVLLQPEGGINLGGLSDEHGQYVLSDVDEPSVVFAR